MESATRSSSPVNSSGRGLEAVVANSLSPTEILVFCPGGAYMALTCFNALRAVPYIRDLAEHLDGSQAGGLSRRRTKIWSYTSSRTSSGMNGARRDKKRRSDFFA